MAIRVKKIKLSEKAGKIIMKYERNVNGNWDEYNFISSDPAAPEMYKAFANLSPFATELIELPERYKERISVYGVSYSYSGDEGVMGAVMSSKMKLEFSNGDLVINTPHKKSAPGPDEEFDDTQYLSEDCVKALWKIESEARKYIDGKRAQTALFGEDTAAAGVSTEETADSPEENVESPAITIPPQDDIYQPVATA